MDFEQMKILVQALGIIIAVVYAFIIKPYIDAKISESDQAKIVEYIAIGVNAAEQLFTVEQFKEKKQYVVDYVKGFLGTIVKTEFTDEMLDTLIEGLVKEVKGNGPKGE